MMRALAWFALACALPAHAIDRIRIRATSIAVADMQLQQVDATLQIHSASRSTLDVRAARATLPKTIEAQAGALSAMHQHCTNPVVREPLFQCPAMNLRLQSARWSAIRIDGKAGFRSDSGAHEEAGGAWTIPCPRLHRSFPSLAMQPECRRNSASEALRSMK